MSTPAWLVVGNKPPFNVMAASPEFPEYLEYDIHEIVGRSMRMLFGPLTHVAEVRKAVLASGATDSSCAPFMLYTKNGQGRMLVLEIVPAHNGEGDATHCVITIDHADWVPKKVAVAEDTRAKLVLKAEKPYPVECVSNLFVKLYEFSSDSLSGRTLRPIFGPRTDAQCFDRALDRAKTGKTQNISLWTCKADMSHLLVNITVFPVVEQGAVCNFMLVFKGAIDVKPTAAVTEGAKTGPPVRRNRPTSMRLMPNATESPARSSTDSEPEPKKHARPAGSGEAESRRPVDAKHAQPLQLNTAELVRQQLEMREGGVERLIQEGCEAMDELGEEECMEPDANDSADVTKATAGADEARAGQDGDDAAGMAFPEALST